MLQRSQWLGNVLKRFETQIKTAVKRCFFTVEPRIIYSTRQLLSATNNDVLLASHHSNVVYRFLFHSDSRYVDPTSQRLQQRTKQYVPRIIWHEHTPLNRKYPSRSSQFNRSPIETLAIGISKTQQLDNTFCKTYHVRRNTTIENSQSSPTDARPSFSLLKPHT